MRDESQESRVKSQERGTDNKQRRSMILKKITLFFMVLCGIAACHTQRKASSLIFKSPEAGTRVSRGDHVLLKLRFPESDAAIDSVVYLLDNRIVAARTDSTAVTLRTDTLLPGNRSLAARLYQDGKEKEAFSNVVIVAAEAPEQRSFSVVRTFPHDRTAFTQGLEFHDGIFYESTGEFGHSTLRKVDPETGKVLGQVKLKDNQFGEGLTVVEDKIIQLTWQNGIGIVYDKHTLKQLSEFPYQSSKEGWGLCFDGRRLIKSDGTNRLYFLNKDTYREEGSVEVYNHRGPVESLNELEFINGKVYANVYLQDIIVIINPETGEVEGELNLIGLLPQKDRDDQTDVLNGIAYDRKGDRLFVTGKKWNTMFQIRELPRN